MNVKHFPDTDTLVVNFNDNKVAQTKGLDENVLVDLDEDGSCLLRCMHYLLAYDITGPCRLACLAEQVSHRCTHLAAER